MMVLDKLLMKLQSEGSRVLIFSQVRRDSISEILSPRLYLRLSASFG
jgi:hypothetical protein